MLSIEQKLEYYKKGLLSNQEMADTLQKLGESPLLNRSTVQTDLLLLMSNPDPVLRYNAIGALAYHGLSFDWGNEFGKQLLSALDVMLRMDEDQDCRRQAAGALGSLFKCAGDQQVINALARVCLNEEEFDDVRAFAYTAVLSVKCVPFSDQPNPVGFQLGSRELEDARHSIE